MNWIKKLEDKWQVSRVQVFIILIVFACTGFTVMFLKKPVVSFFVEDGEQNILFTILYYLLILPIYNVILLIYGFIFGQFKFFWEFEKRMFSKIFGKKKATR
ncbi:DUF6787 family protein [Fulvivirga lutea]|uniref:Prolipoprotein diacylglyceryl transferase n=1 Tax=Fulvivirga lutea TaxID=2810512 RepID=A0A974WI41_9BACT|nr:DUF6787 family protein [Fulvivirga lutea]QSE97562.1 prolipoprotein diacylglyceryl transferase [Fulvivirga lutea]